MLDIIKKRVLHSPKIPQGAKFVNNRNLYTTKYIEET